MHHVGQVREALPKLGDTANGLVVALSLIVAVAAVTIAVSLGRLRRMRSE